MAACKWYSEADAGPGAEADAGPGAAGPGFRDSKNPLCFFNTTSSFFSKLTKEAKEKKVKILPQSQNTQPNQLN